MSARPKFVPFLGECCSKEWISQKLHAEEWGGLDYYLVLRLIDTGSEDWYDPVVPGEKFHVSLEIMAPCCLPQDTLRRALASCGLDNAQDSDIQILPEDARLEMYYEYAGGACFYHDTGDNALALMALAYREAAQVERNLDGILNQPYNRMGTPIWTVLHGKYF